MNMCHCSENALSRSCHFAVFVNLVARSSTDVFFNVHLEHERTAEAACLQRRHEQLSAAEASQCSVAGAFPFRPHTAGELRLTLQEGASCREVTTCPRTIPYHAVDHAVGSHQRFSTSQQPREDL